MMDESLEDDLKALKTNQLEDQIKKFKKMLDAKQTDLNEVNKEWDEL
jgi:hypothetical protein